jgi:hypothetical protein
MKLDLRFVEVSLEDLWCEAVAALVFQEPFDSQGAIFSLNSRTGGYLTFLEESGFFKGSLGSTILLASEGRIKADKILLKGLGPKADCSPEVFLRCVGELGHSLAKLKIRDMVVWIPLPHDAGTDPTAFYRDACITLLRPYEEIYGAESECYLKTVFSFPRALQGSLEGIAETLKSTFGYLDSCSIVVV